MAELIQEIAYTGSGLLGFVSGVFFWAIVTIAIFRN